MNRILKFLLCAALLLAASTGAYSQTKAETRQYNKAVGKPSVQAFDRFLKKYPSSVYAAEISARRDTLLSISPYSSAEAEAILSEYLPSGALFLAFPDRKDAVDRIYGVCISSSELDLGHVKLYTAVRGEDGWTLADSYESPTAALASEGASRQFVDSTAVFEIRGDRYFMFNFLTSAADSDKMSYTAATWSSAGDAYSEVVFEGHDILQPGEGLPFHIEGRVNENSIMNPGRPEAKLMTAAMNENPCLEQIPAGDYLTDAAIDWWLEQNPDATTSATKLNFNILPDNSSLVEQFEAAGDKKSSSRYTAALFDIRGYSVIVVKQKADGNYVLAWAEPECEDHYRDRLLNSITFEDANTLEMFYYHGNRHFDYRLNLTSKTVKR